MKGIAHKGRWAALLLLLAAHLGYAVLLAPRGHYTVDEGAYHMMVKALVEEGRLTVWNGYTETPSAELVYSMLRIEGHGTADPQLTPQYPTTYGLIEAPFYWIAGFEGLFYPNLLAFFMTVWLTMKIARRLFDDQGLALNAALILTVGTFTWEYVHGIWPHSVSMAFSAGAMLAGSTAVQQEDSRRAALYAAVAGLLVGIGAGVRYDMILLLPALVLPFLFASPGRFAPALSLAAGLIPGLLILSLTNDAKFGTLSPFSYGASNAGGAQRISTYLPILFAGLAGVGAAWATTRPRARAAIAARPMWFAIGAVAVVAAVLAVPQARNLVLRLADGSAQLVVDMRIRGLDVVEWGVDRTPGGGVAYGDSLKKALLQNCPWLVILLLPLAQWLRRPWGESAVPALFLAISAFIGFYGLSAWHGGFSLNMRYFVAILPFAAILGARGWSSLAEGSPRRWRRAATVAGYGSIVLWFVMLIQYLGLEIEPFLLNPPLILAGILLIALLAGAAPPATIRKLAAGTGLTITAMAFAWAASVTLLYDLPRAHFTRVKSQEIAMAIAPMLEPDSIVFSRYANPVSRLIEADRIKLAFPRNDNFADFRRLLDLHLDAGRAVYLVFNDEYWETVEDRNLLAGLQLETLQEFDDTLVARVARREGS